MRSATNISIITLIAGAGALVLGSCSSNKNERAASDSGPAIAVTVSTPSSGEQDNINVSGQIESSQSANISTRVMGYITKLNVKVGDHVNKGQLLATISNDDILAKRAQADAMIAQAEAAYSNAKKDYERFSALYKQQSASAKELENATLQYTAAKSGLETAKQMRNEANAILNYTNLTAPFDGIVTQKAADAGNMVNPGMPILTIERTGSYQVRASVPESSIGQIKQGENATVSVRAIGKTISGKITEVSQSSQFSGGQYLIRVNIPDNEKAGLYGGMYANVSIPVKGSGKVKTGSDVVMVPLGSIEKKDDLTGIYTISENNTALLRWVRLGKVDGNNAEVLSGLAKDEKFIVSADGKLFNGEPVKIK
ncbi:efflux RND transporter periplasmic adaptor subunit [Mucilaginibacter ginsenosidivorans]|uniref:Efflux RND transporter periplasmic adaptor subunit n=1 Tax=Mucilaginibacter ginsenosidivorans TaxID=398053 RepID=A0A5B8UT01_9SPHI|nr:efflux RND transporter periplasmic adaptor subunit [Mucilaginibacter ginsenosidivorans]QEC62109.1 efflux RND transporter periplasmic adaptor subunit [Mucilaginibacter ginsenosidivorans]